MQKSSRSNLKVIPKSSKSHPEVIRKSSQRHANVIPSGATGIPEMEPKPYQNKQNGLVSTLGHPHGRRMVQEFSQSHANVIPKSCKSHPEVIQKSSQSHPKVIPKSSESHPNVMRTSSQSGATGIPEMEPKPYQNKHNPHVSTFRHPHGRRMVQKFSQSHANIIPKSCKSHPEVI